MFQFIKKAISICIKKITDLVQREDNLSNEAIISGEEPVAINENVTSTDSKDVLNLLEEQPAIVYDKYRDQPHDIVCEEESKSEVVVVYDKLRTDRLKRSFNCAFPEEDVQEDFQNIVKKIKLNCVNKAAAVLLKNNVQDSIICEALDIDETVLDSFKESKEESESNFNVEPPIVEDESMQNVLKERNEDVKEDVKALKQYYIQLENCSPKLETREKKKYKRILPRSYKQLKEIKSRRPVRL